jgi:hypothetical protein
VSEEKIIFDCSIGWLPPHYLAGSTSYCVFFGKHNPVAVKKYRAAGHTRPDENGIVLLCQHQIDSLDWTSFGFTLTLLDEPLSASVSIAGEKSCSTCSHKNDLNANVCWWCGNKP